MHHANHDRIAVITGASSGIGRAAAEALARQGATIVLASRRAGALQEAAQACEELGGRALAIPTDVTDPEQVDQLAAQTFDRFGRIDAWVNNAALTLFARLEEAPIDVYHHVVQTNIMGYVHGARAALRYFREQGHGNLINVSSVVASMSQPYTSAYVMTKQAIRGLSDCLRMELQLDDARHIHVCTVLPASIDTPLFQYAANYTGRAVKPMQPIYPAAQVGQAIAQLVRHPRRERFVGSVGPLIALERIIAPGLWEKVGAHMVDREHLQRKPAEPTSGNLYKPADDHSSISGGWLSPQQQSTKPKPATLGAIATTAAMLVAAPLALWLFAGNNAQHPKRPLRRAVERTRQAAQPAANAERTLGSGI